MFFLKSEKKRENVFSNTGEWRRHKQNIFNALQASGELVCAYCVCSLVTPTLHRIKKLFVCTCAPYTGKQDFFEIAPH